MFSFYRHLRHTLILAVLCFFLHNSSAQKTSREDIYNNLILLTTSNRTDSAFHFIEHELRRAQQDNDSTTIAYLYQNKGVLYFKEDKKTSMDYLFKALEYYKAMGDHKRMAKIYGMLGSIDLLTMEDRIKTLKKAILLSEQEGDTANYISSYLNLGLSYYDKDWYDSASFYFHKCLYLLQSYTDIELQSHVYASIGTLEIARENYQEGASFLYKAIHHAQKENTPDMRSLLLSCQGNLINAYVNMNIHDSVFHYVNIVQQYYPEKPALELQVSINLMNYYENNNNSDLAFQYSKIVHCIKEEQLNKNKAHALELLKLEYESRIKEEQFAKQTAQMEKAVYARTSFIIMLVLILIFVLIFIYLQKQKAKKERETEKKLMEADLKNSELQRKYLNDELNYTNKELTSFATSIVENHNILSNLKNKIAEISKERSVKEMREQLRELNLLLQQVFQSDMHRQEFLKRSKQLNYSLVFYLKTYYPQLSEGDINILILIFLKFSSKEIAVLYNIEVKSVEQRRYRIRNKLGMDTMDSFDEFFDNVLANIHRSGVDTDKLKIRQVSG